MPATSDRIKHFTESVIRLMTRFANAHGAINLSRGFPDFDPPEEITRALRTGYSHLPILAARYQAREAIITTWIVIEKGHME